MLRYLVVFSALLSFFSSGADVVDISAKELLSTPDTQRLIIDVRTQSEYDEGHVPGAILVPHRNIEHHLAGLQSFKDKPIVLYCESGVRVRKAISVLQDAGFTQIQHLDGDMKNWRKENLPIEK
ncbi:rhodanese-like domain-containing protein [Alteromonadaceae bacterium M269]|nr:rhodanese-like domain-containing protein [Alteromonadaceae bacterium M269]